MVLSKIDVWLRDEKCKPFRIDNPSYWDYVQVKNCMGEPITEHVPIPAGQAHVEVELPPGCYIVNGHVCERGTNEATDTAMVMLGCNQELCVNLIVPSVETCAQLDLVAVVDAARIAGLPDQLITATAQTIMRVGNVDRDALIRELNEGIASLRKVERTERMNDYRRTLKIIESVK